MTKQWHRLLVGLTGGLAGLTALLAATDPSSLELSQTSWAWITVALAAANVVVNAFRQAFEQ